ncbi:50S ribosomal protein L10, partial [Candidatus Pelagibacter sp.]|nr:50S ribosomal protein L10 [Candidatus Pelagibacter sp.]
MSREKKKNYITEMETQFQNNEAVLVTHYQGLT